MVLRKRQTGKRAAKAKDRRSGSVRPDKLDILGKEWSVIGREKSSNYGSCHHAKNEIHINPSQSPSNERDTVLHEIVHALETEGQLKMSERQVRILSTLLLAVLRQNPSLVRYLTT